MKRPKFNSDQLVKIYFIGFLIIFLLKIISCQWPPTTEYLRHYYYLSESLVSGRLDVTDQIKTNFTTPFELRKAIDYAIVDNKYFVYLGVFPAIFGIPFLVFDPEGYLTALIVFFSALIIVLLVKFSRYFLKNEALLTALLLVISSPLLTVIFFRGPWYLASLMASTFGFLFLWHYVIQKRNWSILLIVPLFLTRPTTVFYFLIPLIDIFSSTKKRREKIIIFSLAITAAFLVFTSYNYLRFSDPFEPGYQYMIPVLTEFSQYRQQETSVKDYFLSNLIYLLINPPQPYLNQALRFTFPYFELSRYGVGLIFVIPWFLPYLFGNRQERQDWPYWLIIILISLSILSFGGEGSFQIGPRYACDFFPLLAFINFRWLAKNKKVLPLFQKLLLVGLVLGIYFYFLVNLGHIQRFDFAL
jgi:hypothetical protein